MTRSKAIIVGGNYAEILAREKTGEELELGELLLAKQQNRSGNSVLLQVTNLSYGSQISQQNRELLSGLAIEDGVELGLQDASLRTYTLATCKPLLTLPAMRAPKGMPQVFSELHEITENEIRFEKPVNALFLGNVRSGSKELAIPVMINGKDALTHHMLVAATTGRGKSNLMKILLQDLLEKEFASVLVFDPHAEYASALTGKRLACYAKDGGAGTFSLRINLSVLRPQHFDGVFEWSEPQRETMRLYFKQFKESWIEHLLLDSMPLQNTNEGTINVLKRRLSLVLSLDIEPGRLVPTGIFDTQTGAVTVDDISQRLVSGAVVIVETASLSDAAEVLIATLITNEVYDRFKRAKPNKILSICLEEAPRFIGEEVLKSGPNVFSQIAREGRKFGVGLIAITQLPSLIPRTVLANMNTKIILGIEMAPERKAIIESSPQDLSKDDRIIASLEKGEAIVSSTFTSFAVPIKVPLHRKKTVSVTGMPGLKS